MNNIEKIKADIERLYGEYKDKFHQCGDQYHLGLIDGLDMAEQVLDTLENKSARQRLAEWSKTPEGRESYEKVAEEMRREISEKPMNLDELMKEAQRYYSDNFEYLSSDQPTLSILTNIARHFAQWGAEHLKK